MKQALTKLQDLVETHIEPKLNPATSATLLLRSFGLMKVPLLFAVRPSVIELTDERLVVRIPLSRMAKNHLGSMYFGALAIGADCVVGLLGMHHIRKRKARNVHLSFKDFQAEFLKRPEGDVHFICDSGKEISQFVEEVIRSGERKNLTVTAHAVVPALDPYDPVAKFQLTLSLKRKG
jgi:hypothetical protein